MTVVIVAARRADRLARCLGALRAELEASAVPAELVLVLNSADQNVRTLAGATPSAHVVDAALPLGFAEGLAMGVAAAGTELVLCLHDDAEPQHGWLAPLIAFLDTTPQAGAVASAAILPDGTPQLAGAWLWSDATTSPVWGDGPPVLPATPVPVDYAGSSSLLLRRGAWPGADVELHPAYYVDVDVALRLRAAGWSVWCEPRSQILHHKSSSSSRRAREVASARNRERVQARWASVLDVQAAPGDVERARALAQARAAAPPPVLAPPPPPDRRPLSSERLLAGSRREVALRTALAAALEVELDALEARVRILDDTAVRSHAAAAEAVAAHERVFAELQKLRARQ